MPRRTNSPAELRCLCATVRRASRLLTRRYEEALQPSGLTPSQFELMMTLMHLRGCNQRRLTELLEMDQTTLSRNLRLLERERWIEASRHDEDARQRAYAVTALGLSVLEEGQRCWRSAHAQMERLLGEPMTTLWPTLDRILEAAGEDSRQLGARRTG